ncbi:MAG: phage holin family protein, partial [Pyrinomonadaceae bacterium]
YLVVGGAVGYVALLVLLAAVVIILNGVLPLWASALLVAAAVGAAAYFMITWALTELKKTDLTPTETVESIKEDAQWLKNQVT